MPRSQCDWSSCSSLPRPSEAFRFERELLEPALAEQPAQIAHLLADGPPDRLGAARVGVVPVLDGPVLEPARVQVSAGIRAEGVEHLFEARLVDDRGPLREE